MELIPAHRAGGKGSLSDRRKAETSTFWRVWERRKIHGRSTKDDHVQYQELHAHWGAEVGGDLPKTYVGVGPDPRLEGGREGVGVLECTIPEDENTRVWHTPYHFIQLTLGKVLQQLWIDGGVTQLGSYEHHWLQGRGGGAGERRRSKLNSSQEEPTMSYISPPPHFTHTPTHFDCLLSQSWDGVGEPWGHVGKDLVIHSGGLEVVDEMLQLWRGGTEPEWVVKALLSVFKMSLVCLNWNILWTLTRHNSHKQTMPQPKQKAILSSLLLIGVKYLFGC